MKVTGMTVSTENICYHSEAKIFAGAIDSSNTIRLGVHINVKNINMAILNKRVFYVFRMQVKYGSEKTVRKSRCTMVSLKTRF